MGFRSLWIAEDRCRVHEVAGMGELLEPWNSCQITHLKEHISLLSEYTSSLKNMDNLTGTDR